MGKRLLELSTAFDRDTVRINGIDYELMQRGDLGIIAQMRLWSMYGRVAQVQAKSVDEIAETDAAVIADALDVAIGILIPDLPAAVRQSLNEQQRLAILQGFMQAAAPEAEPPPPTANPPTTAT